MAIMLTKVSAIVTEIHDNSGHQCIRYNYLIGKDRYYWHSMLKDIELYVQASAVVYEISQA